MNIDADSEDHIDGAALLPYPSSGGTEMGTPLSLSLTEFHFILLYKDRILGICSLDDRLAYEESLPIVRHFVPILSVFVLTARPET
jgi:hypothetical protein